MADDMPRDNGTPRRRRELLTFLFLCVVLFPALSIALIGSYGLAVWISHAMGG
ncbi:periplasmic nitrate reductase, NapE protein [Isoalcanivorax indicus]|uniref:periplasmic nitrate reductase, NapE protein n=1 Tax=Isoalcanivorax indicus TaxID=2202653 RepID=UPI001FEB246F|nr:periplasmic nitrate reductase, NapE protein [Isoalcanivorax indicus]